MGDYSAWAELSALSRHHLTPGSRCGSATSCPAPPFAAACATTSARCARISATPSSFSARRTPAARRPDPRNVRRGVTQSASVGYWLGLPYVRRGHMTDAVRAIVPFAFDTLGLHRLEAACLPHNAPSARVLEKAGFRREGTARRYLKINDVWEDHVLHALLHDDRAAVRTARGMMARPHRSWRQGGGRCGPPSACCAWRLVLAARAARTRLPPPQGDRRSTTTPTGSRSPPRRDGGRARRQAAGRHGRRPRRHDAALLRAGRHARHQPELVRVRAEQLTDKPIERWLTAERYAISGSGTVWPDLDARRIERVTPSIGYVPERIKNDRADVFRITLEPGQTVTFVAELACDRFDAPVSLEARRVRAEEPRPAALQRHHAGPHRPARHLPDGGLRRQPQGDLPERRPLHVVRAGLPVRRLRLLAQAVHHPAGGQRRLSRGERGRHGGEPGRLPAHLPADRRLARPHTHAASRCGSWRSSRLSPSRSSIRGWRRPSRACRSWPSPLVGAGFALFLALRGQDRALSLVPTWMLFVVWLFGAGVTFTGRLSGDVAVFGLAAGLVLILMLIGFTVTQFAFRSIEPLYGAAPGEQQLRSLAVDGAGAAVWEWNARREEIKVSPAVEAILGLNPGDLSCKTDDFVKHMHPADRRALQAAAVVGAGAHLRRAPHRVPHAPRRQHLPLVRAGGGERPLRRTAAPCAASASCATSPRPSARRSACCTMPSTTA